VYGVYRINAQWADRCLEHSAGQWHTVKKALESGTVILEVKDGKYEPIGPEDILG